MPTIQPHSKVLVTGANGFIAIWVVDTLLEKGYSVRGTVRSTEKGKHLEKTFRKLADTRALRLGVHERVARLSDLCILR